MLLYTLLAILAACALTVVNFRLAALALAVVPLTLSVLRALPKPFSTIWVNRTRGVDIATMLTAAAALVVLGLSVPGS